MSETSKANGNKGGRPKGSKNKSKSLEPIVEVPSLCQKCSGSLEGVCRFIVKTPGQTPWTTLDYSWWHKGVQYLGYVKYFKICPDCDQRNVIRVPILLWSKDKSKEPKRLLRKTWERIKHQFDDQT